MGDTGSWARGPEVSHSPLAHYQRPSALGFGLLRVIRHQNMEFNSLLKSVWWRPLYALTRVSRYNQIQLRWKIFNTHRHRGHTYNMHSGSLSSVEIRISFVEGKVKILNPSSQERMNPQGKYRQSQNWENWDHFGHTCTVQGGSPS